MSLEHKICAPTDAISHDLEEAMSVFRELEIARCELRSVNGIEFSALPQAKQREISVELEAEGLQVVLLNSSIGKVDVRADFGPQWERLKRTLELAASLNAQYVRVYSFLLPQDEEPGGPDRRREEVIDRLVLFAEAAKDAGVTLLVENLPGSYGSSGERLGDLVTSVGSAFLGVAFNPAGFVVEKVHPFLSALKPGPMKNHVRCLRVSDALFEDGRAVLPDQGNAELRELISALMCRSFDGLFSLDHGLNPTAANFRAAYRAFQEMWAALYGPLPKVL